MTRALWYPRATRRDGPPEKENGPRSVTVGAVGHSMEGTLAGALSVLDNVRRRPDGTFENAGSWTLSFPKVGTPLQHYPMDRSTNHARGGNSDRFGWETEGFAGEPLTAHQEHEIALFLRWCLAEAWLSGLRRGEPAKTIWRHYEISGSSTQCDSDRHDYDRIFPLARRQPVEPKPVTMIIGNEGQNARWLAQLWPIPDLETLRLLERKGVPHAIIEKSRFK